MLGDGIGVGVWEGAGLEFSVRAFLQLFSIKSERNQNLPKRFYCQFLCPEGTCVDSRHNTEHLS